MPTAAQSRAVDISNLRRVRPQPEPRPQQPSAPELPHYLTQSTVMIASLPPMGTTPTDSALRQFYGATLPTRRVLLP